MKKQFLMLVFVAALSNVFAQSGQSIASGPCDSDFSSVTAKYKTILYGSWETDEQSLEFTFDGEEKTTFYPKSATKSVHSTLDACKECCVVSLNVKRYLILRPSALFAAEGEATRENSKIGTPSLAAGNSAFDSHESGYRNVSDSTVSRTCKSAGLVAKGVSDVNVTFTLLRVGESNLCNLYSTLTLTNENNTDEYPMNLINSNALFVQFPTGPNRYRRRK